jgi:hypothetical protein
LAFHPGDPYRALLATAGGDAVVLGALTKAKIFDGSVQTESGKSTDWLEHVAKAGNLVRSKQYQAAATEQVTTIQADDSPEAGFVMGNLLSMVERWQEAAQVYAEVLRQDPDFTEAHKKLGFAMYRLGNPEGMLREAKSALQ